MTREKLTFCLNKITRPGTPMREFLDIAEGAGISQLELRNDLKGQGVTGDLSLQALKKELHARNMTLCSINALKIHDIRSRAHEERSKELCDLAVSLECPAIVLCPPIRRNGVEFSVEALGNALEWYNHLFSSYGLRGFVEPLGFLHSALRSFPLLNYTLQQGSFPHLAVLYDTFHAFLAFEDLGYLEHGLDISSLALVHVSGVTASKPPSSFVDADRGLPDEHDKLKSREQLRILVKRGYRRPLSFEPFAPEVHALSKEDCIAALRRSVQMIQRYGE